MSPLDAYGLRRPGKIRADLQIIADMIEAGSRVLDVGCGDGALLDHLVHRKQVAGRGIELSQAGVNACVTQGLSVIQGDADTDLADFPCDAFDYVILSQTLQAVHDPRRVLEQLVRIGHHAIVSFPNFGFWQVRLRLFLTGRMPITDALPESWHESPNIHPCTIRDFRALCDKTGVVVERALALDDRGCPKTANGLWLANLTGEHGMFLLRRKR